MTKHELIQALRESSNLSKPEATKCVELFFSAMADALLRGERVEIRGLCSLYVKEYESYTGRNPKTGEKVVVKGKRLPFFKAGTQVEAAGGWVNLPRMGLFEHQIKTKIINGAKSYDIRG